MTIDRQISDTVWRIYCKKFMPKYQLFFGKDNIWKIKCRFGHIEPYSISQELLVFYGNFTSSRKLSYFLKKKPENCEVTQLGITEVVLWFKESELPVLSDYFSVKKRIVLSEHERERRCERLAKVKNVRIQSGVDRG